MGPGPGLGRGRPRSHEPWAWGLNHASSSWPIRIHILSIAMMFLIMPPIRMIILAIRSIILMILTHIRVIALMIYSRLAHVPSTWKTWCFVGFCGKLKTRFEVCFSQNCRYTPMMNMGFGGTIKESNVPIYFSRVHLFIVVFSVLTRSIGQLLSRSSFWWMCRGFFVVVNSF